MASNQGVFHLAFWCLWSQQGKIPSAFFLLTIYPSYDIFVTNGVNLGKWVPAYSKRSNICAYRTGKQVP